MLYEVITRGLFPYNTIRTNAEVHHYVIKGGRLDRPDSFDDSTWSLCLQIWSEYPADRPKFDRILDTLTSICANMKTMDTSYLEFQQGNASYLEPVKYDNEAGE